jgi:hypothetical protein
MDALCHRSDCDAVPEVTGAIASSLTLLHSAAAGPGDQLRAGGKPKERAAVVHVDEAVTLQQREAGAIGVGLATFVQEYGTDPFDEDAASGSGPTESAISSRRLAVASGFGQGCSSLTPSSIAQL